MKFRTLKQPCKIWPGRAASAAGLVCRRAPWPTHQSPCPGALASSARCRLPGAPSCGSFIHIIVSNLLMQAVCKYKKGATWVHIEIHLSTPACCCLPRRDVAALLLSLNKSSTCVCDRRFLFQIPLAVCFPETINLCSLPAEHLHGPRLLFLWIVETLLSFSALLGNPLGTSERGNLLLGVISGSRRGVGWCGNR